MAFLRSRCPRQSLPRPLRAPAVRRAWPTSPRHAGRPIDATGYQKLKRLRARGPTGPQYRCACAFRLPPRARAVSARASVPAACPRITGQMPRHPFAGAPRPFLFQHDKASGTQSCRAIPAMSVPHRPAAPAMRQGPRPPLPSGGSTAQGGYHEHHLRLCPGLQHGPAHGQATSGPAGAGHPPGACLHGQAVRQGLPAAAVQGAPGEAPSRGPALHHEHRQAWQEL